MARLPSAARLLLGGVSLLLLALPATGTWSIVVVDRATGEVGVASATCVAGLNLGRGAGVVVVGRGAGQAQAALDLGAENRMTLFAGLQQGHTAEQVLADVLAGDAAPPTHQYGIATLDGSAATYTGTATSEYTGGLVGELGSLHYAIQGNILTCGAVLTAAETALRDTPGDLGTRLMAAMHAAREKGGDGRCSCSGPPTTCGCPPPSFQKSAHVGYVIVARIGDSDGGCADLGGCVNGDYYLDIVALGGAALADPVLRLQDKFDLFRSEHRGHADQLLSEAFVARSRLYADGVGTNWLDLSLVDLEGVPLTAGGAAVSVALAPESTATCAIGAVVDNGDGSYGVPLVAGTRAGEVVLDVLVDDGLGPVTLYPRPRFAQDAVTLVAAGDTLSAGAGAALDLALDAGPALAGRPYLLLATSRPGPLGALLDGRALPFLPDQLTLVLASWIRAGLFPGAQGRLDARGRADARLSAPPGKLDPWVGRELRFLWWTTDDGPRHVSNPAAVRLVP